MHFCSYYQANIEVPMPTANTKMYQITIHTTATNAPIPADFAVLGLESFQTKAAIIYDLRCYAFLLYSTMRTYYRIIINFLTTIFTIHHNILLFSLAHDT